MINLCNPIGINHMTVALQMEMAPSSKNRHTEPDVLFMGGGRLSDADERALAGLGMRKNYNLVYATCATVDARSTPSTYHAVVTDGLTQAYILSNGRLWKRDRRSASILIFADTQAVIKISGKGCIVVRPMAGQYHDHGFDLALDGLAARGARKPGHVPVVMPVGEVTAMIDVRALAATFAAGE
ncbi:hypothetical protein NF701_08950 [Sphingomonadaceae bacterium OTU29THOMA1]|nr:hypothetical protein NF701_08950 [Sphingomonadaceae bacterium OTU29THOMA1]